LGNMELAGLPAQNVTYMLLTVGELKKVEGRLKLFKLQHLLQTEAKIKFDKPDEERAMGYTDYETLNTCFQTDSIRQTITPTAFGTDRYDYELTETGTQLYGIIKSKIPKKHMDRALKVLSKYSRMSGRDLMSYTHKNYIDNFDLSNAKKMSDEHLELLSNVQQIMGELAKTKQNTDSYVMIGKLEHVKRILKDLSAKAENKIQAGTLLSSIWDLENSLKYSTYQPDDASEDLFGFIENYASKEGITPPLDSADLSKLPEEEQECLSKFLNQLKPHLSS